ncbi:hypothetical protein ABID39_001539 [Bartonella japonica]|uniref:Uncharacterized protein n=1 Tax=Bartonella japonica TaxID=357761 RepID=A0ABV2FQU4_9HYPH
MGCILVLAGYTPTFMRGTLILAGYTPTHHKMCLFFIEILYRDTLTFYFMSPFTVVQNRSLPTSLFVTHHNEYLESPKPTFMNS